ncbi:CsbD family protein [Euzebya tangerina]|uniref:CsbD family protein n=1 Tax=Euzebya tangerina TaxID=591198 RepID=UPI001F0CBC69|nr:CsbD family protein [Euzebya tangerina]
MANEADKDEVKGRVKEAVGSLTGDEDLKKEGQEDQAAADIKEDLDEKNKDKVDKLKD